VKEWIVGRNPVLEVLQAKRREVFRLLVASGVEEKGESSRSCNWHQPGGYPSNVSRASACRQLGRNPQGVALEVSAYPYSDLNALLEQAAFAGEPPFLLILDMIQNPQTWAHCCALLKQPACMA